MNFIFRQVSGPQKLVKSSKEKLENLVESKVMFLQSHLLKLVIK